MAVAINMFHCFRWVPVARSLSELVSYLPVITVLCSVGTAHNICHIRVCVCSFFFLTEGAGRISASPSINIPCIPFQHYCHSVYTKVDVCNHGIAFSNDEHFGLVDREMQQLTEREKMGRCHLHHPLGGFLSWLQYSVYYKDCAVIGHPSPPPTHTHTHTHTHARSPDLLFQPKASTVQP